MLSSTFSTKIISIRILHMRWDSLYGNSYYWVQIKHRYYNGWLFIEAFRDELLARDCMLNTLQSLINELSIILFISIKSNLRGISFDES